MTCLWEPTPIKFLPPTLPSIIISGKFYMTIHLSLVNSIAACANNYYKAHSPQVVILCIAACVTLCQLFACWITSMHGPLHPGPFCLAWEGWLVQQPAQYTLHNTSTPVYWALRARWTKEDNLSSLYSLLHLQTRHSLQVPTCTYVATSAPSITRVM